MKGFAILFAILGFCSQIVNAAVARGLTPVPEVEAVADISRVERAEAFISYENNDAREARKETGDELSIDSDIMPREKPAATALVYPWGGHMMYFVYCIYYEQPEPWGSVSGPVDYMKTLILHAFVVCARKLGYTDIFEVAAMKVAYIGRYTDHAFPAELRG
ncbi:hypothetical protein V492_07549 [Pseudogymnoascus sp. VKM F-4246]|nr:hypothetical protein V492_07549 [Pseudogymnoascus sp. VKM F-4246]